MKPISLFVFFSLIGIVLKEKGIFELIAYYGLNFVVLPLTFRVNWFFLKYEITSMLVYSEENNEPS